MSALLPILLLLLQVLQPVVADGTYSLPASRSPPYVLIFPAVSLALLVPAIAKPDQIDATQNFLEGAIPLVQNEPGTIQWFSVKFTDVAPPTFAIFDTFNSAAARTAHLNGNVAAALFANAPTLFVVDPAINKANVLASKVSAPSILVGR